MAQHAHHDLPSPHGDGLQTIVRGSHREHGPFHLDRSVASQDAKPFMLCEVLNLDCDLTLAEEHDLIWLPLHQAEDSGVPGMHHASVKLRRWRRSSWGSQSDERGRANLTPVDQPQCRDEHDRRDWNRQPPECPRHSLSWTARPRQHGGPHSFQILGRDLQRRQHPGKVGEPRERHPLGSTRFTVLNVVTNTTGRTAPVRAGDAA
jgi:hypothetical protein